MAKVSSRRGNRVGHGKAAPIPDWVKAVAMQAARNKQAVMEPKPQLPEDFPFTRLDFGRVRALSTQI